MWRTLCRYSTRPMAGKADKVARIIPGPSNSLIRKIKESDASYTPPPKPEWAKRHDSLSKRYGKWNPTRKLSLQQMNDIRSLSEQMPNLRTVDFAAHYNISPEAIRRILKSKWVPSEKDEERMLRRRIERKEEKKRAKENVKKKYAKAVQLSSIVKEKNEKKETKETKISYDSSRDYSWRKKKKPWTPRPYTQTVGNLID